MKRNLLFVVLSIVAGGILGTATGLWETWTPRSVAATGEQEDEDDRDDRMPPLPPRDGPQPRVEVDTTHHNFGRMERRDTGRHAFVFTNRGQYPLQLRKGDTTCKCTLSELAMRDIPPGGSAEVTLEWNAKSQEDLFRQSATIFTNDPLRRRVTLTIEGLLYESIAVSPHELVFSNLTRDEQATGKVTIYSGRHEGLAIVGHSFEDPATAEFFDVQAEPLPPERIPSGHLSGCQVQVTVKPGLPTGEIRQRILLKTNVEGVPDLELPITGRVGNPVSIVGPAGEWNAERNVLRLGSVKRQAGASRVLRLMIRGPYRKDVVFAEPQTDPDVLHATLGEPRELGNVVEVPLTVSVPPGSRTVSRLGYEESQGRTGTITIDTNRPEIGQVQVKVSFAVTD